MVTAAHHSPTPDQQAPTGEAAAEFPVGQQNAALIWCTSTILRTQRPK
ncbi:unnamed protein product [Echinostoma caproni]|uniref:Uncharacterized protein n=1 Tax=Echinostoma caproni TaxID=27848 RepID=A0A183BFI6_9TREM|nr:unnamed protein product [Echinostoma caproni]